MGAVEEREAVTRLLRARLGERGVYLRIGHENEAVELIGASVVGANYGTHTRQLGSGERDRPGANGLPARDRLRALRRRAALRFRCGRLRVAARTS